MVLYGDIQQALNFGDYQITGYGVILCQGGVP